MYCSTTVGSARGYPHGNPVTQQQQQQQMLVFVIWHSKGSLYVLRVIKVVIYKYRFNDLLEQVVGRL